MNVAVIVLLCGALVCGLRYQKGKSARVGVAGVQQPLGVKVIRRGSTLQFTSVIGVGEEQYQIEVNQRLRAGDRSNSECTDAFMETLAKGGDLDACFDELRDRPDLDPEKEYQTALETGKKEMLVQARAHLEALVEHGQQAQRCLNALTMGELEVVAQPPEGKGICRVCGEVFDLHYIGGINDQCMKHGLGRYA